MSQIYASEAGMHAHSMIGEVAFVVRRCSGRVDYDTVRNTTLGHYVFHYSLSGWGAADIAKAYEENAVLFVFTYRFCHSAKIRQII